VEREQQLPEDAVEDIDDVEELEPEAPPRLRAAGEDILRRGQDVRSSSLESDIGDRLLRVLHQVGRIDHVCHEHAGGLFAEDREPRDEWERVDLEQSTRGFICWCADQLAGQPGSRSSSQPCCALRSRITRAARRSSTSSVQS
jgi:hypothetical protein